VKTKHLAAAVAIAMASTPLAAQQAPTLLTLTATSDVQGAPDVADIGAGVVTQAAQADVALRANSEKMTRVMAALRKAGVADRDIQTSGISVQPQFRYEQNQAPVLTGFQASNRVQVTLRDLKATGRVIDTLVAEGANQIDGPAFRIQNPDPLMDKARQEAVRKARARADLYAAAAGLRVKRIATISETQEFRPPMPMMRAMAMDSVPSAPPPPVAPGEVGLTASITMAFELE
jgi:uncharacterized protein YggE